MTTRAWFYDTWGFLALANAADPDHAVAAEADLWRQENAVQVVTTDGVLDETLTGLMRAGGHKVALRFLDLFEARVAANALLLVEINTPRREAAVDLFRKLAPGMPRLSFTDCTSFDVMAELGLKNAFTADTHFHGAGHGIRPLFVLRRKRLVCVAE